ncbi:MAG TPA: ribonuclease III [Tepidiformaceae bacterium]|nr:ribonuclease III [Tepidiformaceae bacterium]
MALATSTDHARLVEQLGVRPLPDDLLGQALTHASYLNEADASATSNERLEFLGDSVLGMVIASVLFEQFPEAGEGDLTRMRADIVRGTSLARVANRLGLGEHMILGRGEEAAGGRKRDRNLAGAVEAMIGAVYEAHGYRSAKALTRRLLKPELEQIRREGARVDAKSSLQHLVQARWHEPPEYVTVQDAAGEPHRFVVEVRVAGATLGRGEGRSKREAQQAAAQEAVTALTVPQQAEE